MLTSSNKSIPKKAFSVLSVALWLIASPLLNASFNVIATHSILGEWIAQVGGEDIELTVLVPPESDTHTFEPTPDHAVALRKADLIFENGLQLEEPWLSKLIISSHSMGKRIPVSNAIYPLNNDPHIWLNVENAIQVIELIQKTLAEYDPDHAKSYEKRAAIYVDTLEDLEDWIEDSIDTIPVDQRKLITYHNNLGYFADAYDFVIIGSILLSNTTDTADPSAQQFAKLIQLIKKNQVRAIFTDAMSNSTLPQQIARETHLPKPYILYDDALGKPGSGIDSYEKLMRYNVSAIVNALK